MTTSKYPLQSFRLSNVLIEGIEKLAKKLGINKSGAIRLSIEEAIEKHLEKKDQKNKSSMV